MGCCQPCIFASSPSRGLCGPIPQQQASPDMRNATLTSSPRSAVLSAAKRRASCSFAKVDHHSDEAAAA